MGQKYHLNFTDGENTRNGIFLARLSMLTTVVSFKVLLKYPRQ